jgi:hypothetical protein
MFPIHQLKARGHRASPGTSMPAATAIFQVAFASHVKAVDGGQQRSARQAHEGRLPNSCLSSDVIGPDGAG